PRLPDSKLEDALKKIRLIIFDVDGILTDGSIIFAGASIEIKSFHVRDGHGIKIAKRCGLEVALVTGRYSDVVERRARDLGIDLVHQGIWDKRPVLHELMTKLSLEPEEVAVLGDDVVDIPIMRRVGLSVTVPEAPHEVKEAADYVTKHPGGKGAAREVVEMILKGQGKWKDALARYYD
ncbi:MAG: KdsC family phosphatase, partial [Desulfomonilaceae bacterium]